MMAWRHTFRSIISLFFASSSFFVASSTPTDFSPSFPASPSFLASGSEEYHLAVPSRDDCARGRCDDRNCDVARDVRGAARMLELNVRDCLKRVLGIMVGDVYVACALRFGEWGSEMLER